MLILTSWRQNLGTVNFQDPLDPSRWACGLRHLIDSDCDTASAIVMMGGPTAANEFWSGNVLTRVCRVRGPAGHDAAPMGVALGVAAIGLLIPASARSLLKEAFEAILEALAALVFEAILMVAVATAWRGRRRPCRGPAAGRDQA